MWSVAIRFLLGSLVVWVVDWVELGTIALLGCYVVNVYSHSLQLFLLLGLEARTRMLHSLGALIRPDLMRIVPLQEWEARPWEWDVEAVLLVDSTEARQQVAGGSTAVQEAPLVLEEEEEVTGMEGPRRQEDETGIVAGEEEIETDTATAIGNAIVHAVAVPKGDTAAADVAIKELGSTYSSSSSSSIIRSTAFETQDQILSASSSVMTLWIF